MWRSLKRIVGRVYYCLGRVLDASILSRRWQRLRWNIKYRLGVERYVPRFDALLERPHRSHLLEALGCLGVWNSLLEVGCGRGVNLHLVAQRRSGVHLAGVDISKSAIDDARSGLARVGSHGVTLTVADAADLGMFRNGMFDVVMADAVLMYVPPAVIDKALEEMLRVAAQDVVISTWHVDLGQQEKGWTYDEGCWVYDYRRLLSRRGDVSIDIRRYPVGIWEDQRWAKYGVLVFAKKEARDEIVSKVG